MINILNFLKVMNKLFCAQKDFFVVISSVNFHVLQLLLSISINKWKVMLEMLPQIKAFLLFFELFRVLSIQVLLHPNRYLIGDVITCV